MTDLLSKKTDQLIHGSVIRTLFVLAGPIIFANILQTAYQLIDTFWVGRLGTDAVAAVSVSFPFIFLFIALGGGLTVSGSIFVAQYAGAKEYEKVNFASGQTIMMVVIIAAILTILGLLTARSSLSIMNMEADIFEPALDYFRISICGIIFGFLFMVFQSLLRGVGEVKFPLIVISSTVLLNAILDPVLIFGWGPVPAMGVKGAAYATILTQGTGAVLGMMSLMGGMHGISIKTKDYVPNWAFLKRNMLLGIPASIEQSTRSIGMIFMTFLVSGFGTIGLATMGMGMRIISLVIIPAMGLSLATSTIVGQCIGAGDHQRAEDITRLSAKLGFWLLNVLGVLFFIFAEPLIRIFVPEDEALVASSALYIRIAAASFGLMAAEQAFMGGLRGAGDMKAAMLIAIATQWVFQYPLAFILSRYTSLGLTGLWIAFPVSVVLAWMATYWWFGKGKWKEIELTRDQALSGDVADEVMAEGAVPYVE